jgi:hypothetical protein
MQGGGFREDIDLDQRAALAGGREHLIFQHPQHPDRLIKVVHPRYRAMLARRRFVAPLSPTWRFGDFKKIAQAVTYYLECQVRNPEVLRLMPEIHGFARTSLGLGLVCEKIDDGHGGLAPTLRSAVEARGRDIRLRALFDEFAEAAEASNFAFLDVRAGNIVVAAERLLAVDGFGHRHPFSLRRLSTRVNRLWLRRDLRGMRERLGL